MTVRIASLTALVALVAVLAPAPAQAADVVKVGTIPLTATTIAGGATAKMPDGSWRTWVVVSGRPAYLAELDPFAGKVLRRFTLPDAQGSWGVTVHRDGTVYAATYGKGELFRLRYGADAAEGLGRPNQYTSFLWQVDTSAKGQACTGTYDGFHPGGLPPASLACWDPATGDWRDYGTFAVDATYVRATAVLGNTAYAGLGPKGPRLFAVELTSGDKREIPLPEPLASADTGFLYEIDTVGDRWLVVRDDHFHGFLYDTVNGTWRDLGIWSGQSVTALDDEGNFVYVRGLRDAKLVSHNVHTGKSVETPVTRHGIKGVERVTDPDTGHSMIVGVVPSGLFTRHDTVTGESTVEDIAGLVGTPVTPRATAVGPDGRVYVTGYFSGGLAAFDPSTRQWDFRRFGHQGEGMVTHGGKLYLGTYTSARLWEYDPAQPWNDGGNPREVGNLLDDAQDRPYAMASAGQYVAMGTQPGYGEFGGAVGIYHPASGDLRSYRNVVPEQSVHSLTYHDGVLYGGSAAFGGTGTQPRGGDARLFAMNPATGEKLWDAVPVPGEKSISGLTVDADGHLWGVTAGTLFEFDPATQTTLRTKVLASFDWNVGEWNPIATKVSFSDGHLYATARGKVWRLDEATLTDSSPGVSGGAFTLHPDGTGYWINGQDLYEGKFS
ncbi:MAG: hypothetical protein ACRDTU_02775 [Micromonosporaceae bacterium]